MFLSYSISVIGDLFNVTLNYGTLFGPNQTSGRILKANLSWSLQLELNFAS